MENKKDKKSYFNIDKEKLSKFLNQAGEAAGIVGDKILEKSNDATNYIKENAPKVKNTIVNTTKKAVSTTTEAAEKAKDVVVNTLDVNGNGELDAEDIIILAMKLPGVKVNRTTFLKKELKIYHTEEEIADAIVNNPMHAGISIDEINKIADEVIKRERIGVSGISAVLGMPGGLAMAATLPMDITQYYGYMLRTAQELLYLYGWPELDYDTGDAELDSRTINELVLCIGVMYGVAGAKSGILALSKALGNGVEKQLMKAALTKGSIYPIVKSISKWFGYKMTKTIFAGFIKKSIPIIGGVIGGGITFFSFKPCCDKLKESLKDTRFCNPNHDESLDYVDVEAIEKANEQIVKIEKESSELSNNIDNEQKVEDID